ncbi:hypothetical protein GCM10025771_00620 [Niveibacterium umoris]|uniref:ABC-type multidrug transport system permease subunit n=1 Tax=Niveibacterium umoris TaxID=1193620 RepID=A0A840BQT9_9RHOO|nr:hypothetical protein [Niveibacterium umoris]MBB4014983.1 ABC-type multidrug transport system permease subunit [Niveibacterium umoris]
MAAPTSSHAEQNSSGLGLGFVVALVAMLAIMIGSIYYPFPNGKHLDFWGFVALWGREILIVGLSLFVIIVMAVAWLVRLIRGKPKGERNAL